MERTTFLSPLPSVNQPVAFLLALVLCQNLDRLGQTQSTLQAQAHCSLPVLHQSVGCVCVLKTGIGRGGLRDPSSSKQLFTEPLLYPKAR